MEYFIQKEIRTKNQWLRFLKNMNIFKTIAYFYYIVVAFAKQYTTVTGV